MRRLTPEKCTVLIARSGRSPLTLTIQVGPTIAMLAVLMMTPLVLLGATIYSLHQKNDTLAQQNQNLNEAADKVIQDINSLDAEITMLRERAGLSEAQAPSSDSSARGRTPKGGVAHQLKAEELFNLAEVKLPEMSSQFYQQVKPALDETLKEEEAQALARPKGKPVRIDVDVSSTFGVRRNPFGRGYEMHDGIDFPGPQGTPIYSTAHGTVEKAEYQRGYGYHVVINHGYGYRTLYAHLSALSVAAGDRIESGHLIGRLGSTGRSTGPHLHYSIYRDGKAVDPIGYLN